MQNQRRTYTQINMTTPRLAVAFLTLRLSLSSTPTHLLPPYVCFSVPSCLFYTCLLCSSLLSFRLHPSFPLLGLWSGQRCLFASGGRPLCCKVVSDTLSLELSFSISTCCDLRVLKARHSCGRDIRGVKRGRLLRVRVWAEEHTLRDVYTSTRVGGCVL